jgi:hypothetical protein
MNKSKVISLVKTSEKQTKNQRRARNNTNAAFFSESVSEHKKL